jgi:hypothetical protein
MGSSVNNIKITPVNVLWRMVQTETWDFTGLTKTSLSATAFKFYSALNAVQHYVWFDNTGSIADPAVAGFTGHKVTVTTATTEALIASAVAAVVTAITGFVATASGSIVTVKRTVCGTTTESLDYVTAPSLIAYTLTRRGRDYDLGLLLGDVQANMHPAMHMVMAHQLGKSPVAALSQGFDKLEVSTTLLETEKSQLKALYSIYGGSVTPASGTEIYGAGNASQGKNMMVEAGRLVLKPVTAVDDTQNVNYMLAIPIPESLTFSGDNPNTLKIQWQCFIDRDANSLVNAMAIGDVFQTGF